MCVCLCVFLNWLSRIYTQKGKETVHGSAWLSKPRADPIRLVDFNGKQDMVQKSVTVEGKWRSVVQLQNVRSHRFLLASLGVITQDNPTSLWEKTEL